MVRHTHTSYIETNLLRCQFFLYWSGFKAIPVKNPSKDFGYIDKFIQKITKKGKVNRMAHIIYRKNNNNGKLNQLILRFTEIYSNKYCVVLTSGQIYW